MSRYIFSCFLFLSLCGINAFAAQTCDPDGEVQFVCGPINPEDLYQIPDTSWVIASSRVSDVDGSIYAVDILSYSSRVIFPANASLLNTTPPPIKTAQAQTPAAFNPMVLLYEKVMVACIPYTL